MYAHTIDPKTGYPVQHNILSATVIANTCATADAYATSFMVLGLDGAQKILAKHPDLNAGNVHTILQDEIGQVFAEVLADAGVYKLDEAGRAGFVRFLASVQ